MKKTLSVCFLVVVLIIAALTACKQEPKPAPEKEYKIGDTGPAGGIIFYDKGSKTDGWRYLEAAPADLRVVYGVPTVDADLEEYDDAPAGYLFGYYRKTDAGENLYVNDKTEYDAKDCTGTAIGTGKKNTELLVKAMGNSAYKEDSGAETTKDYAANLCLDLVYNEYDDWFLPSLDELKLMYNNLHTKALGGFSAVKYWSSSESKGHNVEHASNLIFEDGSETNSLRHNEFAVRPARAF